VPVGKRFLGLVVASLVLAAAAQAGAKEFRGRIVGTVTDSTRAVLPGVSVTASSATLLRP